MLVCITLALGSAFWEGKGGLEIGAAEEVPEVDVERELSKVGVEGSREAGESLLSFVDDIM